MLQVSGIHLQQGDFSLKDISFTQEAHQKIAITGETGSGKSSLMKVISGLVQPDSGKVVFEGKEVLGPNYRLVPGHPGIAYLSQRYELRNHYRMEELMAYANNLTDAAAQEIFALCRVSHLLKRKTEGLSGGEQQRLALARLLLTAPRLLILDEPFSNLDLIHKRMLKSVLKDIGNMLGMTCLLTSHDPLDVLSWADEMIVMRDGKILQQGTPEKIYRNPIDEYTAGLSGDYNIISSALAGQLTGGHTFSYDKKLMVRPEHIHINKDNGVAAIVQEVHFCGSYYISSIAVGNSIIQAKMLSPVLKTGDKIYLSARMEDVCVLST